MANGHSDFLTALRSPGLLLTSARVSLVVGTVLNVINQADAVFAGMPVLWGKLALNYVVPFCVASYSAARNEMRK